MKGLSLKPSTVLVLSPHTDDGELGCGGTISKWIEEGHDVHYIALSACETLHREGWASDVLRREVAAATGVLGVRDDRLTVLDFEVRQFSRDRQEILQMLVEINRDLSPEIVLAPRTDDLHQDHAVVAMESLRAFKRTNILCYEIAWNSVKAEAACFVSLCDNDVDAKIRALACYRSQETRPYMDPDFIRSQVRYHGVRAGAKYAESFHVGRWFL